MKNKKIVIGILCALVGIMAVGYAVLATQLNITGTASIDSTWKVEITNITERDVVGDAVNKTAPSYTATTANFSVGLTQPTDSITYDIEVSNLGTLKAKVDNISVIMDTNDAIIYKTEGLASGDTLGVNEKDTLSVTVTYNSEVTSQPSVTIKEITVTINYVQDLGQSSSITYDAYSIGDVVTFAGSNWYVIKNSTSEEDYVTLLKETVLTNEELGEYEAYSTSNFMPYYLSDTCHRAETYGYTDVDTSGCAGHNDYEGSKVREFLEGPYINALGNNNLKKVEGYKIRLLSLDDLTNIIGEGFVPSYNYPLDSSNIPTWIKAEQYWLMDPANWGTNGWEFGTIGELPNVVTINNNQNLFAVDIGVSFATVRPVINLLKSSI